MSKGRNRIFFEEVVLAYEGTECLIWPFARDGDGYAALWMDGGNQIVSRLLCIEVNGPPPTPAHQAAHSCGRGKHGCVTKRHLDWKTPKENSDDKVIHGTMAVGERHGFAKITEADVMEIRRLRGKMLLREIGERFGLKKSQVSKIQKRQCWRHI